MNKKSYSGNADNWVFNPKVFDPHPWQKRKPCNWSKLVIHCSATKGSMDIGVNQIDYWHRQRGFEGVGYNYVIRRDGTVETGRPTSIPGAHTIGLNREALGVCLVGGLDENGKADNNFTQEQWDALLDLTTELMTTFTLIDVVGHRDLPNVHKDCPCFSVAKWMATKPSLLALLEHNKEERGETE